MLDKRQIAGLDIGLRELHNLAEEYPLLNIRGVLSDAMEPIAKSLERSDAAKHAVAVSVEAVLIELEECPGFRISHQTTPYRPVKSACVSQYDLCSPLRSSW